MSKGNPFLALRLPHEQQDALRAKAAASGSTLSDLVRKVLADHVAATGCTRRPSKFRPSR